MNVVIAAALDLWGLRGAEFDLIAARENAVYRVTCGSEHRALRLHRKGYRTDQELRSELQWMAVVAEAGIDVPAPIPSSEGALMHAIDSVQVDMLTWVPGRTLDTTLNQIDTTQRTRIFRTLGAEMARLHLASDAWVLPSDFSRAAWDTDGLVGDAPLWDRFWDNPGLDANDRALFQKFRDRAIAALVPWQTSADYGLIHADLVAVNVMIDADRISLIDFDDGGFGFRIFEVATTLLNFVDCADYPQLRDALLDGYRQHRPLSLDKLDLFLAIRAATYVGWNITRMDETDGAARNTRYIGRARGLIREYLNGAP